MAKDDKNKEIPTITSLLNRKKLKIRTPGERLDESQPIDLSRLEKEFADTVPEPQESHPPIEGIDVWDTRGIARAVKHGEAARRTEEFKNLLGPDAERTLRSAKVISRERTSSMSYRMKKKVSSSKPAPPPEARRAPPREPEPKRAPAPPPEAKRPAAPAREPAPRSAPRPPAPVPRTPTGPTPSGTSTVQAAPGRGMRTAQKPPTTWTMEMLKGGPDPLGKGLAILLEKGARTSLFLAITPPPPGAKIPHFAAAAAAKPTPDRLRLWTGLRWDPATVPEVWNALLKAGYIEFHPPGQVTNIGSRRNTIRAAFGLGNEEILLLIRVGPVAACRGILALVSDRSLLIELGPILTLFNTPLPLQKTG